MTEKINSTRKVAGVFAIVLWGTLSGCVVEGPPHARVYAPVVVQDDYVYYPGYQVYYSSQRHQYIYLEGRSWVSRPAPPHVSVDVLFASPSVRLDFHDAPSIHHATIVRQYPKHWAPPGSSPAHSKGNGDDQHGNGRGNQGR